MSPPLPPLEDRKQGLRIRKSGEDQVASAASGLRSHGRMYSWVSVSKRSGQRWASSASSSCPDRRHQLRADRGLAGLCSSSWRLGGGDHDFKAGLSQAKLASQTQCFHHSLSLHYTWFSLSTARKTANSLRPLPAMVEGAQRLVSR